VTLKSIWQQIQLSSQITQKALKRAVMLIFHKIERFLVYKLVIFKEIFICPKIVKNSIVDEINSF